MSFSLFHGSSNGAQEFHSPEAEALQAAKTYVFTDPEYEDS